MKTLIALQHPRLTHQGLPQVNIAIVLQCKIILCRLLQTMNSTTPERCMPLKVEKLVENENLKGSQKNKIFAGLSSSNKNVIPFSHDENLFSFCTLPKTLHDDKCSGG